MSSLVIDKRVLHVANIYADYENMSPAQIMKQAHDRIREQFLRTAKGQGAAGAGSAQEALELQEFFQALKIYQNEPTSDFLEKEKRDVVISILEKSRALRTHGKKYFLNKDSGTGRERGDSAEKDIATIMQAVFNEVTGTSGDFEKLILGGAMVNVQKNDIINPASLDKFAKAMVQTGSKRMYDSIMNGSKKDKFIQVQGKIDVSGTQAKIDVTLDPSDYLQRIAFLLNNANFSIKSYASLGAFDKELKQRIQTKVTKLHLGHTDQRRIFEDVFGELGIPNKVSLSMLYYAKKTKSKKIKQQASNLIFVYELTGYGQKYVDRKIQEVLDELGVKGANYFIYNDPSTNNIYVRSTAELVMTMWNHVDELLERGATNLEKSLFRSI